MANGITAIQVDAVSLKTPSNAAFAPVYIGQAPIWQVDDDNWADLAGKICICKNVAEVKAAMGYSLPTGEAFDKAFSLSMVAFYHMMVELVSPVVFIINNAAPIKKETKTQDVTFVKGQAVIEGSDIIISTLALDGKVKDTDFKAVYDSNGQNVVITDLTASMTTIEATYDVVDLDNITIDAETFNLVQYVPQEVGIKPIMVSAPLFDDEDDSDGTKVSDKVAAVVEDTIDKHWFATAFVQVEADDMAGAKTKKEGISSYKVKACWPYAKVGSYIFPMSLVFSAKRMAVDNRNGGVPYESASNEHVDITKLCTGTGTQIRLLESEADALNAVGIATMAFTTAMEWRTWGVCMANYSESDKGSIAPNKLNDVAVQMMDYVCNLFEEMFGDVVHKPMSMRVVNDILVTFTNVLRVMISSGQMIAGDIAFEKSENSTAELADGQFTYSIKQTNTPPAKAIIAKVTYDSDALESFFAQNGGEE